MTAAAFAAIATRGAAVAAPLQLPRDTRVAARRRLQDAIIACGLPAPAGVAILAAAESYGKALYVEAMERERRA